MSIYRDFLEELDAMSAKVNPDHLSAENESLLNDAFERIEDSYAEQELTEREHDKLIDALGELGFDGV